MSFRSFLSAMNPYASPAAKPGKSSFLSRIPLEIAANAPPSGPTWEGLEDLGKGVFPDETPRDEVDGFLHFSEWLKVQSSNLKALRYLEAESALEVEFKNGGFYRVDDISIREAEAFARAASVGSTYWTIVRVRGKGNFWATRKPYTFLSGPSSYRPQWTRAGGKEGRAVRKIHNLFTQGAIRKPEFLGKSIHRILAPKWGRSK